MKLSLNWLKDHIDPKLSTDELAHRLTMAGLEVEGVEKMNGDTVLDLEITPNRPDALSILGLAREVGAITGRAVRYPQPKEYPCLGTSSKSLHKGALSSIQVSIEDKKDCGRYVATMIKDVRIAQAPREMRARLESLGIRPINNAVDITNFVMMETGQPLHAFDADKLAGGKVIVRRAKQGEVIVTIDGVERKLDPSILIIADAKRPIAIAGIMGGKDAEITLATKNILLESAHFEMGLIRRACRSSGLRSDSSYRFERNVTLENVVYAANRAADLLLSLTGGVFAGREDTNAKTTGMAKPIVFLAQDVEDLLGIKISPAQVKQSLSRLGLGVTVQGRALSVISPAFRGDLKIKEDLIEEIARLIGYDRLPSKLPLIKATNISVDARPRQAKAKLRQALNACGLDETVTLAMTNTKALAKSGLGALRTLKVFNPLSQDQELMRPSLLPSLLQAAVTNINRGQKDVRVFEIGKTYLLDGEKDALAMLLTGRRRRDWRSSRKEAVELFDLKGALENALGALGVAASYTPEPAPAFDPACSAAVWMAGTKIGSVGRLDKSILNNWEIKNQDVYFAVIHLEEVLFLAKPAASYIPISEYPAIVRDVSLAVGKGVPYALVEDICRANGGQILKTIQFIEQYAGEKITAGQKALIFSLIYQSNERTLREDEVNAAHERVVSSLCQSLGATRR